MSYDYKRLTNFPEERQKIIYPYCFWNQVFTSEELDVICEISANQELDTAAIFGASNNRTGFGEKNLTVRKSKTSIHNPNEENSWIFKRLNSVIEMCNDRWYNFDLNGYNNYQYTEYHGASNDHYDWHVDIDMSPLNTNTHSETRKLSISLLLNNEEDFTGGDLQIGHSQNYETPIMKKGTLVLFPSFQLHRVTPVTKGIRKSLVLWVVGPKFK